MGKIELNSFLSNTTLAHYQYSIDENEMVKLSCADRSAYAHSYFKHLSEKEVNDRVNEIEAMEFTKDDIVGILDALEFEIRDLLYAPIYEYFAEIEKRRPSLRSNPKTLLKHCLDIEFGDFGNLEEYANPSRIQIGHIIEEKSTPEGVTATYSKDAAYNSPHWWGDLEKGSWELFKKFAEHGGIKFDDNDATDKLLQRRISRYMTDVVEEVFGVEVVPY